MRKLRKRKQVQDFPRFNDSDESKGDRRIEEVGGEDSEGVADGAGDMECNCGEESAGGKRGAVLAGRGVSILFDEYLVGVEEGDEGEEGRSRTGTVLVWEESEQLMEVFVAREGWVKSREKRCTLIW
ncbi:uncharacterized protein MONOS_12593 [Monocercomonoides exilis]|uniref:uncharacterized protein n=1 Tax=Monocercomonoides exilis TaxID=2049356 RepID=UPI003559B4F0|nr:hypothetical protein MONOS_12593 [Monocercomonoides exilis]|eukprot:MONOS_12593.1-p1 / transcript=MONOS_12593.1 / gene=MONOS_12593 / organism=Monocercomonoides_exilis_PA203 / gene_product=unspecified product / transcript_product=unspecified product / location=Mono_scaffold00706:27951-28331(-) / protein_length=127 / sequence_SO=supercontig / SO=protein_coding / is_pseudo=false